MADCFISYRRASSAMLATHIRDKLKKDWRIHAYLDVEESAGSGTQFNDRLMAAIDESPVFVCLLGNVDGKHTLESEWVLREIERAYAQKKICVPIFQESYTPIDNSSEAIDYVIHFDGVPILDIQNRYIDDAIRDIAKHIKPHLPPKPFWANRVWWAIVAVMLLAAGGIFAITGGDVSSIATLFQPSPTPTLTNTPTPTVTSTATPTATASDTATPTATASNTATPTATASNTPTPTATASNTATPTATASDTATSTATNTPTPTPIAGLMGSEITRNADWLPYEQDIDGVVMVLVPVGCFEMGRSDGELDERPPHQQCLDAPFWIDRTEVTNAQYGSSAWWAEATRPRETISWFDASSHCQSRGGRLPTEPEWEFAARGPDSLEFPWGNVFEADNVTYGGNSDSQTDFVGSRPGGASWVGAVDMVGNVWEWTSSLERSYPYVPGDGRENMDDLTAARVVRGGSWLNGGGDVVNTTYRAALDPGDGLNNTGFRCLREFDMDDLDLEAFLNRSNQPEATPTPLIPIVRMLSGVNLRDGPGLEFPITGSARSGDELVVVGRSPDSQWFLVRDLDNADRWVSADFVTLLNVSPGDIAIVEP